MKELGVQLRERTRVMGKKKRLQRIKDSEKKDKEQVSINERERLQ